MIESEMEPSTITKERYTYVHDLNKGPPEAIDVHHVIVPRSCAGGLMLCTYAFLFAIACFLILLLLQVLTTPTRSRVFQPLLHLNLQKLEHEKSVAVVLWSFTLAGFLLRQLLRKQVEKESVIILPAFGVQLETIYRSGTTIRHFVPIGKILKSVLNEYVTPVTCYWSLSLIIRGEEKLLLVFKELYPPVTMLAPIWKALCAAIDNEESTDMHSDSDTR